MSDNQIQNYRKMLRRIIDETIEIDEVRQCRELLRKIRMNILTEDEKILLENMYEWEQEHHA